MLTGTKIGFIGGGNMAEAIIKGLLSGSVPPENITVAEPVEERRAYLSDTYGIATTEDNSCTVSFGEVIILAVKPQISHSALRGIAGDVAAGRLFISIMAGVKTSSIEAALPKGVRVIRVMPNTPALVLAAASAVSPGTNATPADVELALSIFNLLGTACTVEEKLLDAVTGLSGSGPAYVFTFIEALSDAGVKNGLPRDISTRLAVQTVFGSAKLMLESREHPALLKEKVTSPGGTTIAGLQALEQGGFRGLVMGAVESATVRSAELGKD